MKRIWPFFLIALLPTNCTPAPTPCPTCPQARLTNKWCEKCNVGYVAGVAIKSKLLFDCMDAHGHVLNLEQIKCPSCNKAIAVDGFCELCRIGWLNNQAYFSLLTYELARGVVKAPEAIACPACRKNSENHGWCDHCRVGMVGNVQFKNREGYEKACHGFDIMFAANQAAGRCEQCAMAMVTDTMCFPCRITYKDGKQIPATAQPGIAP